MCEVLERYSRKFQGGEGEDRFAGFSRDTRENFRGAG